MIADKIQEHGWHKAQKDWVKELVEEPTKEVRFGMIFNTRGTYLRLPDAK